MKFKIAAVLTFSVALSGGAYANDLSNGPEGNVVIQSREVDGLTEFVSGAGRPIELEIKIKLPREAGPDSRVPAFVILHGGGGTDDAREETLADFLQENGVAGVVVDTFGSRGIRGRDFYDMWSRAFVADQSADAIAALEALQTHPSIDPSRIFVVGASMGAWTAMVLHSTGTQGFAGYVGLYGPCTWAAPVAASDTPILLLQGGSDSSISVNQCSSYIDAIKSAGGSAELGVYPNAAHTFIHKGLPSGTLEGFDLTGGNCEWSISADGTVTGNRSGNRATTDRAFINDIFQACAKKGGLTYNYDREAQQDAFQRILNMAKK